MIAEARAECVRRLKAYDQAPEFGQVFGVIPQNPGTPPFTYVDLFGLRDPGAALKDEQYVARFTTVRHTSPEYQTNTEISEMDPLIAHHRNAIQGVGNGFTFVPAGEFGVDERDLRRATRGQVGPHAGGVIVAQTPFLVTEHAS